MKRKYRLRLKKPSALILAFIIGCLIMPFAIDMAYKSRGYSAVGGEYLIPLLFLLIVEVFYDYKDIQGG